MDINIEWATDFYLIEPPKPKINKSSDVKKWFFKNNIASYFGAIGQAIRYIYAGPQYYAKKYGGCENLRSEKYGLEIIGRQLLIYENFPLFNDAVKELKKDAGLDVMIHENNFKRYCSVCFM